MRLFVVLRSFGVQGADLVVRGLAVVGPGSMRAGVFGGDPVGAAVGLGGVRVLGMRANTEFTHAAGFDAVGRLRGGFTDRLDFGEEDGPDPAEDRGAILGVVGGERGAGADGLEEELRAVSELSQRSVVAIASTYFIIGGFHDVDVYGVGVDHVSIQTEDVDGDGDMGHFAFIGQERLLGRRIEFETITEAEVALERLQILDILERLDDLLGPGQAGVGPGGIKGCTVEKEGLPIGSKVHHQVRLGTMGFPDVAILGPLHGSGERTVGAVESNSLAIGQRLVGECGRGSRFVGNVKGNQDSVGGQRQRCSGQQRQQNHGGTQQRKTVD